MKLIKLNFPQELKEQYEARLDQKDDLIKELHEEVAFLKEQLLKMQ